MLRTHTCGELTEKNVGQEVTLAGWVDTVRDHGGVTFIDLRDRYGKTQVVLDVAAKKDITETFKSEDCIQIRGRVRPRPKGTENLKLLTGRVEIAAGSAKILNACDPLPFEVTKSRETNEDLRLQYRYLDLRNPAVQKNLFLRHRVCQIIRSVLDKQDFIEVETPILTKSTPEGARDYLVPSRLNPGEFFALPQSPQLFKQILMVSGFDRYFQIAKCFRDEDLRADRQPEFTQLDIEMSFLEEDDLFSAVEGLLKDILKEIKGVDLKVPFPRLTYQEAMAKYGSDKPDLRFGLAIEEVSEAVSNSEFKVFKDALAKKNGAVAGICLPEGGSASKKDIESLTEFVKAEGALGLAYFKVAGGKLESPIAKFVDEPIQSKLIQTFKASTGDLILLVADEKPKALKVLGALRLYAACWKNLVSKDVFHFSWVTDFPLFKYNEEEKRLESEHHPFTSPNLADWELFKKKELPAEKVRSRAYDLVLNGNEIASGSVRIHSAGLQKEIFESIGIDEKEAELRFGFLLKAFKFAAPPHGGIALGIDRVMTILLGLESIRDVIAFPKNQKAACPVPDDPSPVNERQLKELHIRVR